MPETERRESERFSKVNIEVPSAKEVKTHEKTNTNTTDKTDINFFIHLTPLNKSRGTGRKEETRPPENIKPYAVGLIFIK